MAAGSKSLAHSESMSAEMSLACRRKLGITRRIPDTTMRQLLVRLDQGEMRKPLQRQVKAAHRRKALKPVDLPFGVVAMDGKSTRVEDIAGPFSQRRTGVDGKDYGLVRTVTSTLISSGCKLCLDASPILAGDNEQTHYEIALNDLLEAYGGLNLFKLVTYDAGACSQWNAKSTRLAGLHYLMRVKSKAQPKLSAHIMDKTTSIARAVTEERVSGHILRRSVFLSEEVGVWHKRTEMRTMMRVLFERVHPELGTIETQQRLYVSSLSADALTGRQWITVTRNHWNVENNCHHTFDAVFQEDNHPWIVSDSTGMLAVLMLRRIAYNILTLYRDVTQRAKDKRLTPWRDIIRWFYNAFISSMPAQLKDMRTRNPKEAPPPSPTKNRDRKVAAGNRKRRPTIRPTSAARS
jgi:hypothetical protein